MDKYTQKYIKATKACKNNEDLELVINKIYQDGYEDGGKFKRRKRRTN